MSDAKGKAVPSETYGIPDVVGRILEIALRDDIAKQIRAVQ